MTGPETPDPEAAAALSWAIKATEEYLQARYPGPSAWPPKRTRQLDVLRTLLRQLRHGDDDARVQLTTHTVTGEAIWVRPEP